MNQLSILLFLSIFRNTSTVTILLVYHFQVELIHLISYYYKKYYQGKKVAFTVNIEDEMFSEYDLAKKYADILNLDLIDIKIDVNECFKLWYETGNCLDEPNGDTATITNLALVKESSKYVKCLITGDGGDEIFEGYNRHAASDFLFPESSLHRSFKFFFLKRLISNEKVFLKLLRIIKPSLSYGDIKARTKTLERVISQNPVDIEDFYHQAMSIDTPNIKNFFKLHDTQVNRLVEFDRKFYLPGTTLLVWTKFHFFIMLKQGHRWLMTDYTHFQKLLIIS